MSNLDNGPTGLKYKNEFEYVGKKILVDEDSMQQLRSIPTETLAVYTLTFQVTPEEIYAGCYSGVPYDPNTYNKDCFCVRGIPVSENFQRVRALHICTKEESHYQFLKSFFASLTEAIGPDEALASMPIKINLISAFEHTLNSSRFTLNELRSPEDI